MVSDLKSADVFRVRDTLAGPLPAIRTAALIPVGDAYGTNLQRVAHSLHILPHLVDLAGDWSVQRKKCQQRKKWQRKKCQDPFSEAGQKTQFRTNERMKEGPDTFFCSASFRSPGNALKNSP
jgi:hypothetical protein